MIQAGQVVVLMLSPTLVVGGALYCPRGIRAIRRRLRSRRARLEPDHPPIEQLASDLRRLLERHEVVRRSPSVAKRAQHLLALEGAISDCAGDAALALGVPWPDRSGVAGLAGAGAGRSAGRAPLATTDLRVLLCRLAAAGLVLGPATGLFVADGRF